MTQSQTPNDSPQFPKLPFRVVGLTGGIASGKSTVSDALSAAGITIIDADLIAREVVEPGTSGLNAVREAFGESVILPDGALDRKQLGALIFSNADARARLSAILHPLIAQRTAALTSSAREAGLPMVIYDAPLIVENNLQAGLDLLIVVAVDAETQLLRLMARDQCAREDALNRINAQLPLGDKVAVADVVIDNNGSKSDTRAQVVGALGKLPELLWPDDLDAARSWLNACARRISP